MRARVIPTLLLHNGGLVKSVKFKNYKYLGDPINAVKIFNEKEVDEIAIIDIDAFRENRSPDYDLISEIASEAFMPLSYGGGISSIEQIRKILFSGVEKIILNKAAHTNLALVTETAKLYGSQSVVISVDVKKNIFGKYKVYTENGKVKTEFSPEGFAKKMENAGAGEILLNNIDRDGTFMGYDLDLIRKVSSLINIPLIAIGGAGKIEDLREASLAGAAGVAAGSLFVFQGKGKGILINYPSQAELRGIFTK